MTASAAIATSAIQAASSATGDGLSSGLWSFLGGLVGAAIAVGIALWQQSEQRKRERIKMAVDSAGSHMANVAFDKYVQFCEAYSEAAGMAFETLFRRGPHEDVLQHAGAMSLVRLKWSAWTTSETDEKLKPFEAAFREIGATAGYVDRTADSNNAIGREDEIEKLYALFAEVIGLDSWRGEKMTGKLAQTALTESLRDALGTERFHQLRKSVIDRALSGLAEK